MSHCYPILDDRIQVGRAAIWASAFRSNGRYMGSIPVRGVIEEPRSTQPSIPPGR